MKFTKGPWKLVQHSWAESSVMADHGYNVCDSDIRYCCDEETQEGMEKVQKANMTLIAAAPELYEALEESKELLRTLMHRYMNNGVDDCTDVMQSLINSRLALAKARGES